MIGIKLNKTDFDSTNKAIHDILIQRDDYNSETYASPIPTTDNLFILLEPKKVWLTAIKSLNLTFTTFDNSIILKSKVI